MMFMIWTCKFFLSSATDFRAKQAILMRDGGNTERQANTTPCMGQPTTPTLASPRAQRTLKKL